MPVSPDARMGEESSVTLCLASFPLPLFSLPEHWQSEAWLYLHLGALCITHLLIVRFQVSVQTASGIIYFPDNCRSQAFPLLRKG